MGKGGQSGKQARNSPRHASPAVLKPLPHWTQPGTSPDAEAQDGMVPLLPLESLSSASGHPESPEDRRVGSLFCARSRVHHGYLCTMHLLGTSWPLLLPLQKDS